MPIKYVESTKETAEGFIYKETAETCRFCEKGKIVSGIYLQFNTIGHPCCTACYEKTGFNEWFHECMNTRKDIPKQLDWFVEMFYRRGLTPEQAIENMLLVV